MVEPATEGDVVREDLAVEDTSPSRLPIKPLSAVPPAPVLEKREKESLPPASVSRREAKLPVRGAAVPKDPPLELPAPVAPAPAEAPPALDSSKLARKRPKAVSEEEPEEIPVLDAGAESP